MNMRYRLLLISLGAIMILVLGGCSGQTAETGGQGGATPSSASPVPSSAAPAAQERVVTHAMGETTVPANPQRVVVLDTGELDSALALGIKPVGAVSAFQGGSFPSYLSDKTEGITSVGTIQQPNLEAIAALKPDLILSSKLRHEAIYPQLSQIAPTVFTESVGVTWKENFKTHAEALGKTAEADRMLADYTKRLDQFKAAMGDRLPETQVSIVRFLPGEVRIYLKKSFIGTILSDAGLPRPPAQDKDEFADKVTKERIPDMDGSVIFTTSYGPSDKTAMAEFTADPLWSQLNAVQQGKVYQVSDDYWMLGIGILAANQVVDDLNQHFIEQ
ncbi:Periplasmic binding protein (fragment) [Nitrolancea hollandica Lb]|uniref:Periplasmic binding protein n=2 Tax=Nitrolancea hollandica TaxID=1206749 RepID=I4EJ18_9BACT